MFEKISLFSRGIKDGVTVMLNASGAALVTMYDKTASGIHRARSAALPSEKNRLEHAIRSCTTKIHSLQYEIGIASARNFDSDSPAELELRANIARVRDNESKIADMRKRLAEIEEEHNIAKTVKKMERQEKKKAGKSAATATKPAEEAATHAVVSPVAVTAEADAVAEDAADSKVSERNDTVRVLAHRSKKVSSAREDVNDTESIAA